MQRKTTGFCRFFFAALLIVSAIGKLLDNRGFAEILRTYELPIQAAWLLPIGLAISLAELGLGLGVALGHRLRTLAQVNLGMQLTYLAMAVVTNLRGLRLPNCGCFGVFLGRPMNWFTVLEDVGISLLAFAFLWAVRISGRASERATRFPEPRAA